MRHIVLVLVVIPFSAPAIEADDGVHLATGIKIGEVTQTSAIVWARATANKERNWNGERRIGRAGERTADDPPPIEVDSLEGAVPGQIGQLRLGWSDQPESVSVQRTAWIDVGAATDFTHQFKLSGLEPATKYHLSIESRPLGDPAATATAELAGSFMTAARPQDWQDVSFSIITGQAYRDLDHKEGYHIYDAMTDLGFNFIVPTGDTVYYDSERPRARTKALARHHWHRIYSLPRVVNFHRQAPGYWEKDDHDTYNNDGWPGQEVAWMKPFTFQQGQAIFREQVPMGTATYRTVRWGRGLQIWMVEGRDFRSPNNMPDGPNKTIWGKAQLDWLMRTVEGSDAKFRVLISPTPIVGPDRTSKNDNHANRGFDHEGNLIRAWAGKLENFYICCGDRHWQYMSIDPETGTREFSCGPVSDEHAGGTPGHNPQFQPYHNVIGGFLGVAVFRNDNDEPVIAFRFHDVHGNVVHEWSDVSKR